MAEQEEFYRIQKLPPYVFEEVNTLKAKLRAGGRDIIDLGMGNPDMPTPAHIVEKLVETARNPKAHRYSVSRGIIGLRRAMARYYKRRFDVELSPETEIVATIGSKEGFANLAQAITGPGDVILAPNPAYPIHAFGFIIAGGVIAAVPAPSPEAYLKGVADAIQVSHMKPRAIVLNYPSNPTAQVVDLCFYKEAVALAKKHDIYILSDLAYGEIFFGENPPPSILQVDGARDIAVEINSLSKTFAMAGWRMGMAVGNERLINALARVKSYLDYGAFTPIQVAAVAALDGPWDCVEEIRSIYKARRDTLIEHFSMAGWDIPSPEASMFAWAPIPEKFREMGSVEFAKLLIERADVAVAPGLGFGEEGDGHVRIGLVENQQRIRQAARNLKKVLKES
ncbi:LL-diaminopimelate aminotransferase [Hyphococcus flavus]|uniref:Aminotransferase n=1 Tax=Hyphococcus flavus TaxID=1866326 RepID=A0AAE9ZCB6_9PROT|nr:LL-diaminopimelate aminotransferase [Hyphococcus flavus]WDI30845.1 LL-diaminopimelate aminotransferase [Hyphococcus flavus]